MDNLLTYVLSILPVKDHQKYHDMPPGPEKDRWTAKVLSQWITRPELAERVVAWAGIKPGQYVLEPSCGTGNFTKALKAVGVDVTTCDIDPRFSPDICRDYRSVQFSSKFHWAVGNPPYENGLDTDFLEKAVCDAEDVVFVIRIAALAGIGRYERVWKHVTLAGLAILPNRPDFLLVDEEIGSARSDFCVVHYTAREGVIPKPVEWWG